VAQRTGRFEGQRQDRATIADRVATYGLKVFCTACGKLHRHFAGRGERLRNIGSACCAARMRPSRWSGWPEWRLRSFEDRREEPAEAADPHVVRVGRDSFMRGLDS